MNRLPLEPGHGGGRFRGFDVMAQSRHWDEATSAVVVQRLGLPVHIRFFDRAEEACANALFDQLLDQREEPRVPVTPMVDARLAEQQFDGWHYEGMPRDDQAWRLTLAHLDGDARALHGRVFADLEWEDQTALLHQVHDLHDEPWHGLPAERVWSLWTRYACTAFYSHPWAWNEIGFPGPAYPRGYKNLGLDSRDPHEVPDARPDEDPLREASS